MPNEYGEDFYHARKVKPGQQTTRKPTSLGTIDDRILNIEEYLEIKIDELHAAHDETTEAKRKWLSHRDHQVLLSRRRNEKTSEDVRDTLARTEYDEDGTKGLDLWIALEDAEGHEKALRTEVSAIQSRLSALQSVANHVFKAT